MVNQFTWPLNSKQNLSGMTKPARKETANSHVKFLTKQSNGENFHQNHHGHFRNALLPPPPPSYCWCTSRVLPTLSGTAGVNFEKSYHNRYFTYFIQADSSFDVHTTEYTNFIRNDIKKSWIVFPWKSKDKRQNHYLNIFATDINLTSFRFISNKTLCS